MTAQSDQIPLTPFAIGGDEGASVPIPNAAFTELMAAVLERGAPFRFAAPGRSMSPFIRDGDVVTIAPAPARIRLGDVVAFVNPQGARLTVHRVVGKAPGAYRIRGDNTAAEDGVIAICHILGRVTRVERAGRNIRLGMGIERVSLALLSRQGWLIPAIGPLWRLVRPVAKMFSR